MTSTAPAPTPLSATELGAWRGFLFTHDTLWKAMGRELDERHGIDLPTYELLMDLAAAGRDGRRMAQLAHALRYSGAGLTRLVDRLERRGIVVRTRCEEDRRGFVVTLTADGRTLLRAAARTHSASIRRAFLDRLSPDEQQTLAAIWDRLLTPTDDEGTPR